jgi:DNA adenine methylase
MRTFIKWLGNKSKHTKHLLRYVPENYNTYIEPFIGSGALFIKLQPKKWIINDLNKDLISVWNTVKDNPNSIIAYFKNFAKKFIKMSKEDKVRYCKTITSSIEGLPYGTRRAIIYLLMKYCSYMGTILRDGHYRFYGLELRILVGKYFFLTEGYYTNLRENSEFLNKSKGKIYNKDYKFILSKAKKGDFVFLDPPYIEPKLKYQFQYNTGEKLDNSFLQELLKEVKKLDAKHVYWMMTQADTPAIRKLFNKYTIKTFKVYRLTSKSYKNELIIMNY